MEFFLINTSFSYKSVTFNGFSELLMGLDFHKNNQPQIILCQRGILKGTNSALLQSCCCCCSIAKLYPTCDPMNCQASLSFTLSWSLLRFMFIDSVTLSNRLILLPSSPPAFNLSQQQGLFQWVGSSHQVSEVLELQHQLFQWIFRVDFL